jgi:hypothetical protein
MDVGAKGDIDPSRVGIDLPKLTSTTPMSKILGKPHAGELPALVGIEEVAIGGAQWPRGVAQLPPRSTN